MDEKLQEIITAMVNNGESHDVITSVISEYKTRQVEPDVSLEPGQGVLTPEAFDQGKLSPAAETTAPAADVTTDFMESVSSSGDSDYLELIKKHTRNSEEVISKYDAINVSSDDEIEVKLIQDLLKKPTKENRERIISKAEADVTEVLFKDEDLINIPKDKISNFKGKSNPQVEGMGIHDHMFAGKEMGEDADLSNFDEIFTSTTIPYKQKFNQIKDYLQEAYPDYDFKTSFISASSQPAFQGKPYSTVTMISPDGDEETVAALYNDATKNLTPTDIKAKIVDFVDTHGIDNSAYQKLYFKQEEGVAQVNAATAITPEQQEKYLNKFDAPDLFDEYMEKSKISGFDFPVQPYKAELEETKSLLQKIRDEENKLLSSTDQLPEVTDQEIQDYTRQRLIAQEKAKLKSDNLTDYLEENEDEKQAIFKYYAKVSKDKKFTQAVAAQTVFDDLVNKKDSFVDLQKQIRHTEESFTDPTYLYVETDDVVTLENGKIIPRQVYTNYTNNVQKLIDYDQQINDAYKEVETATNELNDVDLQLELLGKDYGTWRKFKANIGTGFSSIGMGLAYGLGKASQGMKYLEESARGVEHTESDMIGAGLDMIGAEFTDWKQGTMSNYANDVRFDDAFSSVDKFGRFFTQELGQQIPILTTIITTGGTASPFVIGAYTMGEKYMDMDLEDIRSGKERSEWEKFGVSLGYGASEAILGTLPTTRILGRGRNYIDQAMKRGVLKPKDYIKMGFKEQLPRVMVYEPLLESSSEGLTQISQNLLDGRPIMENVDHAMFSGGMFGFMMSSSPVMAGMVMAKYQTPADYKKFNENTSQLAEINNFLQNTPNINPAVEKNLQKQKSKIQQEIDESINEIENLVKNQMSPRFFNQYKNLTVEQERLREEAQDILESNDFKNDPSLKNKIIDDLNNQFNDLQFKKDLVRNHKSFANEFALLENGTEAEQLRYQELKTQAEENVRSLKNESPDFMPSNKDVMDEAYNLYVQDNIESRIKSAKRSNGVTFKVNRTNKEAIQAVKEAKTVADPTAPDGRREITEKERQDLIDGIEAGTLNGVDDLDQQSYVFMENAISNERTSTIIHEPGHQVFKKILGEGQADFIPMVGQIAAWLEKTDPEMLNVIRLKQSTGATEKVRAEEFVMEFMEQIDQGKIDFDKTNNKKLASLFGYMASDVMSDNGGFNLELKGQADAVNFLINLAAKIRTGTLTEADIEAAKESDIIKALDVDETADATVKKSIDKKTATNLALEADGDINNLSETKQKELTNQYELIAIKALGYVEGKGIAGKPKISREEAVSYVNQFLPGIVRRYNRKKGDFSTMIFGNIKPKRQAFYGKQEKLAEQGVQQRISDVDAEGKPRTDIASTDLTPEEAMISREAETKVRKGIKLADRLGDNAKKISEKVKKMKPVLEGKTYKTLKDLAPDDTQRMFGITPKTGNLTKEDIKNAQRFIAANADVLIAMLPEGATESGTATGVQKVLLNEFYNKSDRKVKLAKTGSKAGLQPFIKKPNIKKSDFLKVFGITQDGTQNLYKKESNTSSRIKALVDQTGKLLTNQAIREVTPDAPKEIAEGKSRVMFSEDVNKLKDIELVNTKAVENLGRTYNTLIREDKGNDVIYLDKLPEFIERINIGEDIKSAFINTYGNEFLTTGKDQKAKKIKKDIIKDWETVVANFPKQEFVIDKPSKRELNEYLYEAFDEQTERQEAQNILGLDKKSIDFTKTGIKQLENFKNSLVNYFSSVRKRFDNDLDFYKYILQHYGTMTSPSKIGNMPNAIWNKDKNGIWRIIEGPKTKRGTGQRYGLFNNDKELVNVLIKPAFDVDNNIKVVGKKTKDGKPTKGYDILYKGKKIDITRAPQSDQATTKYLKEFKKTGTLSDKTLTDSYNDAIANQEAIIDYLDYYKNNKNEGITLNDVGMYFMTSTSGMTQILRSAYPMDSISLSKSDNPSDYRFEHNPPVRVMKIYMAEYVDGKITKAELKKKFKDASVSVIPKLMDDVINIRYKDTIPLASVDRFSRYYNSFTFGKFPYSMTVFTPNFNNKGEITSWSKSTKGVNLKKAYDNMQKALKFSKSEVNESRVVKASEDMSMEDVLNKAASLDEALRNARNPNAPVKKIRVFDFDDTLARTKSNVLYTMPDGTTGKLTAEEFAKRGDEMLAEGAVWDFSEFNKVMDGKKGPLFEVAKKIQEARGTDDVFVLTARAQEASPAIKEFLDAIGLNIPLKNISGLGDSSPFAKSNWIVDKAAEGYNDFYFADDAIQNVKAVRNALEVLDVKSKTQQAKIKFSEDMSMDFNTILEESKGIDKFKVFSDVKAQVRGARKGRFKFFIPPSAEDFQGLLYSTLGKGKQGERHLQFYDKALFKPYAQAMENLATDRVNLMADFKALKKDLDVPKDLRKQTESGFTNEQAVRVYLWNKTGQDIPGISKTDLKELTDIIENDPKLKVFADQILSITKGDGYSKPGKDWAAGTITTDLMELLNTTKRGKYLETWQENVDIIFSKENMNKLEAILGKKYREALENSLARMKAGRNRIEGGNRLSNRVLDYINNSTGAIMFFNMRSALLQTISSANFINWSFNNPYKAGKAFANQPQYWKDFVMLMNSDYLKDRRNGLKLNINESEIANAAKTSKNKAKAVISYIIEKGYTPTKFADSFAIASGGAMFYRNRIIDLMKNEGKTKAEAEKIAMQEFRRVSEISQQSSDPSKISQQQSTDLGRVVLQFVNTPMQYARIQKRAAQDIINRRGDDKTNVSKIVYYAFLQNMMFNALQSGLFAIGFGDDDDLSEGDEKKIFRTANGMMDSWLRGLGMAGVTVQVLKNLGIDIYDRSKKDRPEYTDAWQTLLQFSPAIKSKLSKFKSAAYPFDSKKRRAEVFEKGFSLDNPAYESAAKVITATTNIPLDRVFTKVNNIKGALDEDTEAWQSTAMILGWPEWQIKDDSKSSSSKSKSTKKSSNKKRVKRKIRKKR
jgi:hypothetical protein